MTKVHVNDLINCYVVGYNKLTTSDVATSFLTSINFLTLKNSLQCSKITFNKILKIIKISTSPVNVMWPLDEIDCPAISGILRAKMTIKKIRDRTTCIPCVEPISKLSNKFTIVNKLYQS